MNKWFLIGVLIFIIFWLVTYITAICLQDMSILILNCSITALFNMTLLVMVILELTKNKK